MVDDQNARSVRDVAENLLIWAKNNNLFSAIDLDDVVDDERVESGMLPERLMTEAASIDVLRRRSVNHVAYSEPERKVIVFTNNKLSKADEKLLPQTFEGISIEYMRGGIAQVKASSSTPDRSVPYHLVGDAVACGSSIFPVNCQGAGTLGALVRDQDDNLFGLTNNHVTGACNLAMPGLPIISPGTCDATADHIAPFCIGRHSRLLPINDGIPENVDISINWDAAAFSIEDETRVSSMQGEHFDTPSNVGDPQPGLSVQKVGRTTGLTEGTILGQFVLPLPVVYSLREYGISKEVFFEDVYVVTGENGKAFSKPGDSGSLVVMTDANGIKSSVGLVFAGNENLGQSFILPLNPILGKMGLDLVTGHNVI